MSGERDKGGVEGLILFVMVQDFRFTAIRKYSKKASQLYSSEDVTCLLIHGKQDALNLTILISNIYFK